MNWFDVMILRQMVSWQRKNIAQALIPGVNDVATALKIAKIWSIGDE